MPTNLYGTGDNYDPNSSHVIPALIRRYELAAKSSQSSVTNWGSGLARREFLFSDDLAAACLHLLENYDAHEHINVGVGQDMTIKEIAEMIANLVGYVGESLWDASKPDGTPRKVLDVSKIHEIGWKPSVSMEQGLSAAIEEFKAANSEPN
jgi:GDP-L-fucose synthase